MNELNISRVKFDRLKFCNFKLESLLDVTLAINDNLPNEQLLNKYRELIQQKLNIGKVLVYRYNKKWEVILESGLTKTAYQNIVVERDLLPHTDITTASSTGNPNLEHFDVIIPVYHNNAALAFVLIGDIDEEKEGVSPTIKHLHFIQTLTNIIMVAIENHRLHEESLRQEAMKKELELASKMQAMLIPDMERFPRNQNIRLSAYYHPHYDVGGDYYDVIKLSEKEFGFCIADVSGKGISAAILMSNFQANLRALFTAEIPMKELVSKLNERVMSNANGEKFITLFIAKYNFETEKLLYINAGHNPPVLYKKDEGVSYLTKGSVGLGMLDEIPVIALGEIHTKNSKLICFTDGLIEIEDENHEQIGTRVLEDCIMLEGTINENIKELISRANITENNEAIFDDISIIAVEFI